MQSPQIQFSLFCNHLYKSHRDLAILETAANDAALVYNLVHNRDFCKSLFHCKDLVYNLAETCKNPEDLATNTAMTTSCTSAGEGL